MAFPQRVKDRISIVNPSDEELVSAYVDQGDERAFRMLVERHQERVFGFLLGMVRDRTVANDLFQETYIRVVSALQRQRASYSQQGRFLGWVLRIARNAALDHLRTRKRWQDVSATIDESETSFWDRLPDNELSSDVVLHNSEQESFLRDCINFLLSVLLFQLKGLMESFSQFFNKLLPLLGVSGRACFHGKAVRICLHVVFADQLSVEV